MKSGSDAVVFRSKRNTVLLRGGTVEKRFAAAGAAAFEAAMLERLRGAGVCVPGPVTRDGRVIKMPYIAGETLPDLFVRLEKSPEPLLLQKAADGIVAWLGDFYRAAGNTGEIRGDVNGRNFLWDGERVWGVDFEEQALGPREKDIGRLIAFAVAYDPPGTSVKVAFADRLLNEAVRALGVSAAAVFHYRDLEFEAMAARRGTGGDGNGGR